MGDAHAILLVPNMLRWETLTQLTDDELEKLEVAETHLACAAGLRGSEALDIESCLRTLEAWTGFVADMTADLMARYEEHGRPPSAASPAFACW